ncbi:hypothetical protein H70357_06685 [Paenibacillus sp. FSL H7-0357]|uniref:DUF6382 domain-containing protein n=1 Tax=Paenibacillus sp. FSL H7-0357 TaxID=1536774 RepID=UPI0004F619CB|nr:DUF6382 domain-containing protein [Paenibacillus sp. FSL H7-0357]AIQ16392.1 hypothetical protein H70357_06685 [Paenibacillus sp. FSL H7-0357]
MFGLSRDFVQQDGISLLLGKPDGLSAGELNMVQARMLMNSGIPYHLRLLLREIDLQVTLEYSLSRRKMLSHLLKSDRLSMNDFFGLLLQIAQGMEEGRLYMLRAEQYALHEDYIFVEGPLNGGRVYLTCIPLQQPAATTKPGECLRSLIMVMMASVTELAGSGVQRLLQYCGGEDFTPAGLRDLLSELLTAADPVIRPVNNTELPPEIQISQAAVPPGAERHIQEKASAREAGKLSALPRRSVYGVTENAQPADNTQQYEPPWNNDLPKLKRKDEEEETKPDKAGSEHRLSSQSSANRTYVVLGGVLAGALLWKFLYLNSPKPLWLAVCAIATLVLGGFCWLVWSERLVLGGSKLEEAEEGEEDAADKSWRSKRELEWDFGRNPVTPVRTEAPVRASPQLSTAANAGVPAGIQRTEVEMEGRSMIKPPVAVAATALLSRENLSEMRPEVKPLSASPYLERCGEDESGPAEIIELNRASFIIGRSPEVAQYVEKSEGASRVHAEISKSAEGYILKDLDSRNGTLYQGEAMIPYKEYPLNEGSVFTIVKGSYTFHSL